MSTNTPIKIVGIIQKSKSESICYDTSYKTYQEAVIHSNTDFKLTIACKLELNTVKYFFIDFSKFIRKYHIAVTSWEELEQSINESFEKPAFEKVLTYTSVPSIQRFKSTKVINDVETTVIFNKPTEFKSNMDKRPFIFGFNYSNYVTAGYCNIKAPKIRNKPNRRSSMPDLVFTKKKGSDIFLENCLVSVNGVVGLPIYDPNSNELFVKNGANMLKDANRTDQNIVFLDFTKLMPEEENTALSVHKLKDCSPDLLIKKDDSVWLIANKDRGVLETYIDRDIDFWQRASFSMRFAVDIDDNDYNQIPVICLGGRLFFPGIDDIVYYQINATVDDKIVKKMVVEFNTSIDLLAQILASNLQHAGIFYGLNTLYRASIGYIISNIYTDREYNFKNGSDEWKAIGYAMQFDIPFVGIIKSDKFISIDKLLPNSSIKSNALSFPKNSYGILINNNTREIVDYTIMERFKDTAVLITPQTPLYLSKREGAIEHTDRTGDTKYLEIPDTVRYDTFAWEHDPVVYKDNYNKLELANLLKDINSFFMADFLYAPNEEISLLTETDKQLLDDTDNPEKPVLTIEYTSIKNKLREQKSDYEYAGMYFLSSGTVSVNDDGKVVITGLPESLEMYNRVYDEIAHKTWAYVFDDNSSAIISYDSYNLVWKLVHYSEGTETPILQTVCTSAPAPYTYKLEWLICGSSGIVILEDPDEESEGVADPVVPDDF